MHTAEQSSRDSHRSPEGDGVLSLYLDPADEGFLPSCFSVDEVRGLPGPLLLDPCLLCEAEGVYLREQSWPCFITFSSLLILRKRI